MLRSSFHLSSTCQVEPKVTLSSLLNSDILDHIKTSMHRLESYRPLMINICPWLYSILSGKVYYNNIASTIVTYAIVSKVRSQRKIHLFEPSILTLAAVRSPAAALPPVLRSGFSPSSSSSSSSKRHLHLSLFLSRPINTPPAY